MHFLVDAVEDTLTATPVVAVTFPRTTSKGSPATGPTTDRITEQYLDSTGMFKEAMIGILAAVAKQERVRLSERTIAGLQRAKAQGRVGGRPRTEHDPRKMANLAALRQSGASIRRIADELGLSPTTVARLVRDQAPPAH